MLTRHEIPPPFLGERPTAYADRVGGRALARRSKEERKKQGLYLTSVPVADFMAAHARAEVPNPRVLDPAAGTGTLACAIVEKLAAREPAPTVIDLTAYEVDPELQEILLVSLSYLKEWCQMVHGVNVQASVVSADFIKEHENVLQMMNGLIPWEPRYREFDAIIANPPYFKVNKADPRSAAVATVVNGQPNIYSLFMAVSAALLRRNGKIVFITPRSFASGNYFRRFREVFFEAILPQRIHVFDSRRDAFKRDDVLQENIILWGTRYDGWRTCMPHASLTISSSQGIADIEQAQERDVDTAEAFSPDIDSVLRLPLSDDDARTLALVDSWPNRLSSLGLEVSTGPVVPFRAANFIANEGVFPEHVPFLWMNHVQPMRVQWPINKHKPEHISVQGADGLLLANKNYVLLHRFSAKEQPRRLTAAPYLEREFTYPLIGLENHLNYIYRPSGMLSEEEAWGLSALYNSGILDQYFRCLNGNTQVSATELRSIPLPEHNRIVAIGKYLMSASDQNTDLDALVAELTMNDVVEV